MKRRQATFALAALAAVPFTGKGQPTATFYRIGFLGLTSAADYAANLDAFLRRLRELGYEDGRNIDIEYRWADGREERLPELAVQLVRRKPDVLVTHAIGVSAAQQATSTIPIVMGVSADPVASGLIKSLGKPGGNTTGVASQIIDIAAKRLELLKEAVPKLKDVAVLSNLALLTSRKGLEEMAKVGRRFDMRMRSFGVSADPAALESTLAAIARERPDGLVVQPDPLTGKHGVAIAAFAARNRLPTMAGDRQFVVDGGLASYGADFLESWRLAARYVDKILKGAKPADLPVEQLNTFELVVNAKTAKALGLTLPPSLLVRAELIRE
jgi:putative ABC transport system substrate-binding protein